MARYCIGKCRCRLCKDAHNVYQLDRRRKMAYGTWAGNVPAEPVRAHVRALMEAPEPWQHLADRAGVGRSTVSQLLYGNKATGKTSRSIRKTSADRLLALTPQPTCPYVDATGSRRRAQALLSIGWTYKAQAELVGLGEKAYQVALKNKRLSVRTADRLKQVYERLENTPAPVNPYSRRAKGAALRARYMPPAAWDPDTIDDPAIDPFDAGGEPIVDEVAVERVCQGVGLWSALHRCEQDEVLRQLLHVRQWTPSRIGKHLRIGGGHLAGRLATLERTLREAP
jgi:hypothetical protein